jgi:hypothetical protein
VKNSWYGPCKESNTREWDSQPYAANVHNVISGRIWIDMVGEVKVVAHATGETAKFRQGLKIVHFI